jgi:hypothetical protein
MKWIWMGLIGIAFVIAAAAALGAMLPVAHAASRQARFQKSAETIWGLIAREKTFREDNVNYQVTESAPPRRLVTRIADKNLPYGGSWTYDISPGASGCTLRITENGEVYNPLFRFVSRFVMGHTATIDKRLTQIGKQLGEPVRIED